MKKLLYLLLLVPLTFIASCSKDDDVAPFDMTLTLSGVTQVNNTFYAVSGDNVTIDNLKVTPVGGKETMVSNVMFFLNDAPVFPNPWNVLEPISFSTQGLPEGVYNVGVAGNLLQVDQSIKNFAASYTLVLVGSNEELPEGAPELGTYSQTINFTNN